MYKCITKRTFTNTTLIIKIYLNSRIILCQVIMFAEKQIFSEALFYVLKIKIF